MGNATRLVLIVVLAQPVHAAAQAVGTSRESITLSVGVGGLIPYQHPERPTRRFLVSLQAPFGRRLFLEAEASRSTGRDARSGYYDNRGGRPYVPFTNVTTEHDAVNLGANLLVRSAGGRLSPYFGGGLGLHQADTTTTFLTRCEPRAPGGCDDQPETTNVHRITDSGPSWQLVGGVDARIGRRLTIFGDGRWLIASRRSGDTGLGVVGGIRIALQATDRP
jgi:hypothetical protein